MLRAEGRRTRRPVHELDALVRTGSVYSDYPYLLPVTMTVLGAMIGLMVSPGKTLYFIAGGLAFGVVAQVAESSVDSA